MAFAAVRPLVAMIPAEGFPASSGRPRSGSTPRCCFSRSGSPCSSLLFGFAPALAASRPDLQDPLKEGQRGGTHSTLARGLLVAAEVALAAVLLAGAGLLMRSFLREQSALPGFETERLVTGEILLGGTRYFDKTPQDMNQVTSECEAFFDRVLERVRALPGVRQAGIISRLPFDVWGVPFTVVGRPEPEVSKRPRVDLNEVDAEALPTLGIRLLRGRGIEEGDVASAPWVAVVNKTFADRHFPGESAVGKAIRLSMGDPGPVSVDEPRPREIVGVVADVAYPSFYEQKPAAVYIPFRQHVSQYAREDEWIHTRKVLVIRTTIEPLRLVPAVQAAVAGVDRDQAAHDYRTMEERVRTSPFVSNSRFFATLFGIFGALAVLLAMVGVYGVMSWVVGQRTGEFGIRMALGATARDVIAMLLGQSLRPILVGLAVGALGGYGLSRALNALFFRMTGADPLVFGGIAVLMTAVALGAAWVPARRVTRIHPQQALRCE